MSWLVLVIPVFYSLAVQFSLWLNLLFPYNFIFEHFNRNLYFAISLSGLFGACISVVFFKLVAFQTINKIIVILAMFFQVICALSCLFFFLSSMSGWLLL